MNQGSGGSAEFIPLRHPQITRCGINSALRSWRLRLATSAATTACIFKYALDGRAVELN
jgi:hypothetical protein